MGAFWGPWICKTRSPPKKKPANQKSTFWGERNPKTFSSTKMLLSPTNHANSNNLNTTNVGQIVAFPFLLALAFPPLGQGGFKLVYLKLVICSIYFIGSLTIKWTKKNTVDGEETPIKWWQVTYQNAGNKKKHIPLPLQLYGFFFEVKSSRFRLFVEEFFHVHVRFITSPSVNWNITWTEKKWMEIPSFSGFIKVMFKRPSPPKKRGDIHHGNPIHK